MDVTSVAHALLSAGTLISSNLVLTEGAATDALREPYFPVDPADSYIGFRQDNGQLCERGSPCAPTAMVTHVAWRMLKTLKTTGALPWVMPVVKELSSFSADRASFAVQTPAEMGNFVWLDNDDHNYSSECRCLVSQFDSLPLLEGQAYRARACVLVQKCMPAEDHGFTSRPWRDSIPMWSVKVGSRGTCCLLPPGHMHIPEDGAMPVAPRNYHVPAHWRRIGTMLYVQDLHGQSISIEVGGTLLAVNCCTADLVLRHGQSATIHNVSSSQVVRVYVMPVYKTVAEDVKVPAPLGLLKLWVGPFGVSLRHQYTTADLVAKNWKPEDRQTINTLGGDCLVVQVLLVWNAFAMYRNHQVLVTTPKDMLTAAGPVLGTTIRTVSGAWEDGQRLVDALLGTPLCVLLCSWSDPYEDDIRERHQWCDEEGEDYDEKHYRLRFTMAVPCSVLP